MIEKSKETSGDLLEGLAKRCPKLEMGMIPTYYSRGFDEKAKAVQKLMDDAILFYKEILNVELDLRLFISDKKDFYHFYEGPYGIPFIEETRQPHLVFMPCESGAVLEGTLGIEDRVAPSLHKKLENIGHTYESAALTYVDLIALHEIGHAVLVQLGLGDINHWFNELMATYIAYTYMMSKYPIYAQVYMDMSQVYFADPNSFERKTLARFDRDYDQIPVENPANYDWYQKKLNRVVQVLYDIHGVAFINLVQEGFKGEIWTHENTMKQLENICPKTYQLMCQFNNKEEV